MSLKKWCCWPVPSQRLCGSQRPDSRRSFIFFSVPDGFPLNDPFKAISSIYRQHDPPILKATRNQLYRCPKIMLESQIKVRWKLSRREYTYKNICFLNKNHSVPESPKRIRYPDRGWTPLHWACASGHSDASRLATYRRTAFDYVHPASPNAYYTATILTWRSIGS